MPANEFARLVKSLNGLEETRLANAVYTLHQYHDDHAENETADDRLFRTAKGILTDIDELEPHLKALQTGNLRETRSKREMRETKTEIDRIITDLHEFRTLVGKQKEDIQDSDAYLTRLEDVETSIEPQMEYLRTQMGRIDDELGS